ncbi:MAG: response regulator transcription factor [Lactobacillaceae bacterium]|jgi:DNA-binding response OmpR family regulator|nr:response regulator transcription factor [Lactobacillaceae bacterium]
MKILLVEDDEKLGSVIVKVLQTYGYDVDWAKESAECLEYVEYNSENTYDVILLDWMLPGKNGDIICKELREPQKYNFNNGIIFLTAKDAMDNIVKGLDIGADDYIVKPFENSELIARIKSVNRRKSRTYIGETAKVGNITINRLEQTITTGDKTGKLSKNEFHLFDLFAKSLNKVISRDVIMESVWGINEEISQANIDSFIYLLRKKLKSINANLSITLYKSIGYKLEIKNDK